MGGYPAFFFSLTVRAKKGKFLGEFLPSIFEKPQIWYNLDMKTITIEFRKRQKTGLDELRNPIYENTTISVAGCLVEPISEPQNARENQAMERGKIQVRVHLPKVFTGDVSKSAFDYNGVEFETDTNPVEFMRENTPTKWNRYFRAEAINE